MLKLGLKFNEDFLANLDSPVNKQYKDENNTAEAEFTEFKPRLKFELRLKNCWFHLKLYSI